MGAIGLGVDAGIGERGDGRIGRSTDTARADIGHEPVGAVEDARHPQLDAIGQSAELFAAELIQRSLAAATKDGDPPKTFTAEHIKQCVASDPLFDFLRAAVDDAAPPPPKRSRQGSARRPAAAGGAGAVEASGDAVALAADHRPLDGLELDDDYDE